MSVENSTPGYGVARSTNHQTLTENGFTQRRKVEKARRIKSNSNLSGAARRFLIGFRLALRAEAFCPVFFAPFLLCAFA
jgi:hypothetical protein